MAGLLRVLRFGVFEIHVVARELRRRGYLVPLPPQPFAVLTALAGSGGRIVSREELCALLWPDDVHVDRDRGLNHCLNRIRRALGDDAHVPRFVETVPRLGYRFLASVEAVVIDVDSPSSAPRPAAPPSKRPRAVQWLAMVAALVLVLQRGEAERAGGLGGFDGPSPNATAQAAFEDGRRLLCQGPLGWRRSLAHFREAARLDPSFAPARCGLAEAYLRLGEQGTLPADEAFAAARRAAEEALSIQPGAEPLALLAQLYLNYEWDWAAAEDAYLRALRIDPEFLSARLGYARLLSASGRHAEALTLMDETEARNPDCPHTARDAAMVHYRARRWPDAARRFASWARLDPEGLEPPHALALLLHLRGQYDSAAREAHKVLALARAPKDYMARFESLPPRAAMRFYIRGSIVHLEGLRSAQWVTGDEFARLWALEGEPDQALSDLERAADERSPRLLPYLNDPAFDALRTSERFRALQRRVRVPRSGGATRGRLLALAVAP
jgi:DNA-binding winged helix-turn-helix (wHTH) protein/tetratricopeptide (TPR) repeat protein